MAVIPFCTGPVDVWVAPPTVSQGTGAISVGAPRFLGYGEVGPKSVIHKEYSPVMSDRTGNKIPRDLLAQGEQAFIFINPFAEWDEAVYALIDSAPSFITRGTRPANTVGTMMLTEGRAYSVYLHFPYGAAAGGHPAFPANGMPVGYRFPGSILIAPQTRDPGTQPNKLGLSWHCLPVLVPATGVATLYDFNMTGIPLVPPS